MKKILMSMAAVAAMVGCAKDAPIANVETKEAMFIVASIDLSETRVTVEGEKFTDVKWEQGDNVALVSVAGASATLTATASGDTDVRFEGEGTFAADTDTYYAIYPATTITNGVATFDLATQSGDDAAILASKAEDVAKGSIPMTFKPVNSLLHVSVSGIESIAKAEFMAYDGATLATTFAYDIANDTSSVSGEATSIVIENPAVSGFFFSLPAGLDMANGYVVRLTDVSGNVCVKAYNGKTFARGTTTRVAIEWSLPSVTLGAKTSYSYYAAGDSATANACANTDIFFVTGKNGESCASSYTNVQDAMISDLGYEVDGTTYTYSAGQVSWDRSANTFCINETPSCSTAWGEKTAIKAFVVVDGKKYYSNNNLWITGLPYGYNFVDGSLDAYRNAGWSTNGQLRVSNESLSGRSTTLVLHHYVNVLISKTNEMGFVVSPQFQMPSSISVQPQIVRSAYCSSGSSKSQTGYVGAVSSITTKSQSISFTDKCSSDAFSNTKSGENAWLSSFSLTSSTPYISISSCTTTGGAGLYYFLFEAHFRYAE